METPLKVGIGCDHAGFDYKEDLKQILTERGFVVTDFGTYSTESVDYPDYVHPLSEAIENHESDMGVLVCGSANGVAMTANKHQHVRAAVCWNNSIAELSRQHNNANVICIPARFVSREVAAEMMNCFIDTDFDGGRHMRRVEKIAVSYG